MKRITLIVQNALYLPGDNAGHSLRSAGGALTALHGCGFQEGQLVADNERGSMKALAAWVKKRSIRY